MLRVKTILKKSDIQGIGVFAAEPISKGSIVFEFDVGFDFAVDKRALDALPKLAKEYLLTYGGIDKETGKFRFAIDNIKHMNHDENPNVAPLDRGLNRAVAVRDIKEDEELTCNYNNFDLIAEKILAGEFDIESNFDYCKI